MTSTKTPAAPAPLADEELVSTAATPRRRRRGLLRGIRRSPWLYLMLLPGVVYFAIFKYAPMYGVTIAFQDYLPFLGMADSPWVGWKHFERLFSGPDFGRLLSNTLILAFLNVVIAFPAPVIVALMLNELRTQMLKKFIQTAIYVPHFLSWAIVSGLTYLLFALDTGPITVLFNGVFGTDANFLADPDWFRPLIIVQTLWKSTGWGTIIYLAALAGVDKQLYEAAMIDGASRLQQLRHVTIPAIVPTVIIMMILNIGNFLDTGFEQIYMLTNSLNREVADVFDTYVYFMGITNGAYSYSTAIGLFKGIVGLILILGANWLARRFTQSSLF
ncbi:MAG TPA: ABC transporter permease subunit [Candidatus Brachybacterium merdavium]|uniref:ABC transporter permease subunit n=1 Tax=Candidatus Brachybacterium merdavium TaxID=2838513 RepID=A0A9D2LCW4_9MICO|nr:ABC transporter permease subunit [Candidatus Brachybacterium merdavium]